MNVRSETKATHEMGGGTETRGRAVFSGKAHKSCVYMTQTRDERNTHYHQGDNALPDVYNMPDTFTQELRREGFCREHPLVSEVVEDL